jgi:hypothetical protein
MVDRESRSSKTSNRVASLARSLGKLNLVMGFLVLNYTE